MVGSVDRPRLRRGSLAGSGAGRVGDRLDVDEAEARRRDDAHATVRLALGPERASDRHDLGILGDLFFAITGYATYEDLVEDCGWDVEEYEAGLLRLLRPLLA